VERRERHGVRALTGSPVLAWDAYLLDFLGRVGLRVLENLSAAADFDQTLVRSGKQSRLQK
jgi:hypothetical protein